MSSTSSGERTQFPGLRRLKERRYLRLPTPPPPSPAAGDAGAPIRASSLWRDAWYRYLRNRAAVIAGIAFLALLAYCLIWPLLSPYDPNEVDFSQANDSPSLAHPLGTDQFGRDLFTRVAKGGQVSIGIGFAATIAILVVGIAYGSISGFVGGRLDNAMMRFLDALYGLPYLPFAILSLAIIGTVNFWTMVVALTMPSSFGTYSKRTGSARASPRVAAAAAGRAAIPAAPAPIRFTRAPRRRGSALAAPAPAASRPRRDRAARMHRAARRAMRATPRDSRNPSVPRARRCR